MSREDAAKIVTSREAVEKKTWRERNEDRYKENNAMMKEKNRRTCITRQVKDASPRLRKLHAMKDVWVNGGVASRIPNLSTRLSRVICFTLRLSLPWERAVGTHCIGGCVECCGQNRSLCLCWKSNLNSPLIQSLHWLSCLGSCRMRGRSVREI